MTFESTIIAHDEGGTLRVQRPRPPDAYDWEPNLFWISHGSPSLIRHCEMFRVFVDAHATDRELLTIWVPGLAAFLSIILGLAPMRGVLQCRRRKSLGEVGHDPL